MRKKADEENFEEAESQAYKCWTSTVVPSEIKSLFASSASSSNTPPHTKPFHILLKALEVYTSTVPPNTLPLSSTLPDMKASTKEYVEIQRLYKDRSVEEKNVFKSILNNVIKEQGEDPNLIDDETIDSFVKNCHILRLLKGKKWGWIDSDKAALGKCALKLFEKRHNELVNRNCFHFMIYSRVCPNILEAVGYPPRLVSIIVVAGETRPSDEPVTRGPKRRFLAIVGRPDCRGQSSPSPWC